MPGFLCQHPYLDWSRSTLVPTSFESQRPCKVSQTCVQVLTKAKCVMVRCRFITTLCRDASWLSAHKGSLVWRSSRPCLPVSILLSDLESSSLFCVECCPQPFIQLKAGASAGSALSHPFSQENRPPSVIDFGLSMVKVWQGWARGYSGMKGAETLSGGCARSLGRRSYVCGLSSAQKPYSVWYRCKLGAFKALAANPE